MSPIQSIDHASLPTDRMLPTAAGTKGTNRPAAEITPEPHVTTARIAAGSGEPHGAGVPRTHPVEPADNLLARMPGPDDRKATDGQAAELHLPPEAPGQLAVVLLSMLGHPSGAPTIQKHSLDVIA